MYTYQVDGVQIDTNDPLYASGESLLNSALGLAAVISFQKARPVVLYLNGQPYRLVTVNFVNSTTSPPPPDAI